jgi:hypothetical protein
MKKKSYRYISIVIALLLVIAVFAGCNGGGSGDGGGGDGGAAVSQLSGPTEEILQTILDEATASINEEFAIPATFTDPVTSENAPGMLGMTPDDFVSFVDEATVATAAIATFAFQVAVIKANSVGEVGNIIELVMDGYDSGKWICVFPERSLVMGSGQYVLLAVGTVTQTDALVEAFRNEAGGVAFNPNIFYEGEVGGFDGGEGGGMGLDIGPAPID